MGNKIQQGAQSGHSHSNLNESHHQGEEKGEFYIMLTTGWGQSDQAA